MEEDVAKLQMQSQNTNFLPLEKVTCAAIELWFLSLASVCTAGSNQSSHVG